MILYIALCFYQIYLKFARHNKCALTSTVTIHAFLLLRLLCLCFSSIYPDNLSPFLHTIMRNLQQEMPADPPYHAAQYTQLIVTHIRTNSSDVARVTLLSIS